jgi:TRAP-type mannitol/chloroaromatic compound transport system permease small subunit
MERIDKLVSRTVPWLTLFMVLVTFVIVLLRYVFARGWVWMQEIVLYMHAFVFLLAAAHTLARDAHVRVDILYRPLQPGKKALVNLLGAVFLLIPSCAVLFYQSLPFVLDSWQVLEGSKDGGGLEAVFVLKTAIPVFCLLLLAQAVSVIVRSLEVLRKPPP